MANGTLFFSGALSMKRDSRLDRLCINFALFAFIASCLIGIGQRSSTLPLLISSLLVVSLVFTDWLGVIRIPRLLAYITMLAGAIIAIVEFFVLRQIDQLTAVAKLLIYVQIGLMFQRKDRRVFEQWGIFLLLEMIVASLVNDNVLYGILLLPVLLVGCSALLAYASYVSNLGSGSVGVESNSVYARMMRWLGREHLLSQESKGISMRLAPSANSFEVLNGTVVGLRRATSIVISVVVFSVVFFYVLPRLQSGAYEGAGWHRPAVGFSGEVSLDDVGELLETNSVALKVRFISVDDEIEFQPSESPYIRGAICHSYIGDGHWKTLEKGMYQSDLIANTPAIEKISSELQSTADAIDVIIEEQVAFDDATFSLPPFSRARAGTTPSEIVTYDWRMLHPKTAKGKKLKYRFRTYAYNQGKQQRFLPVFSDCLDSMDGFPNLRDASVYDLDYLRQFRADQFPGLLAERDRVLAGEEEQNIVNKVLILEEHLVNSGEFTYSLAPSLKRRIGTDPIEDFVSNHKTGHCQYFASTMAMMLRSLNVPSRIVLGFRPSDFNSSGVYFLVRQRHAHAWVEAYLPTESLKDAGIDLPQGIGPGAWLRLDPTPGGEGSNAGGSIRSSQGQLESLQQFWQDYVINVDKSNQPQALSFFNSNGTGSLAQLWRNIEQSLLTLQSSQFIGGLLSPDRWFSWQAAVGLSFVVVIALTLYRVIGMLLRRYAGGGRKKRAVNMARIVDAGFYRRIVKSLARLNLRRSPQQTPLEFANHVANFLQERPEQFADVSADLSYLTSIYYRLRFGFEAPLQEKDLERIEAATKNIEALAAQRNKSTRKSKPVAVTT